MKTVAYDETQWRLVPVAPTQEMSDAGRLVLQSGPAPMPKLYRAMLDAAPTPPAQHPTSTPDGCSCETCSPNTIGRMRMIVCSVCGNKRCPHATDHRNACTGSNEPGQPGSAWEHVKPISAPDNERSMVGEAGSMPGTSGFTMAVFKAADVPVGTKLYIDAAIAAKEQMNELR